MGPTLGQPSLWLEGLRLWTYWDISLCMQYGDIPTIGFAGIDMPSVTVPVGTFWDSRVGGGMYSFKDSCNSVQSGQSGQVVCTLPSCFIDLQLRTSFRSWSWYCSCCGSEWIQIAKVSESTVVSMPASRWSAHSEAMFMSDRHTSHEPGITG